MNKQQILDIFKSDDPKNHTLARGILEGQYPKYLHRILIKYSRKELKDPIDINILKYYIKSLFKDNGENLLCT